MNEYSTTGLPQVVTARVVLNEFLDLLTLAPNPSQWSENEFADNPPRLIRLRRFRALMGAFGLHDDVEGFTKGKFIDGDDPKVIALLQEVENGIDGASELGPRRRPAHDGRNIQYYFDALLKYRIAIQSVLTTKDSWMLAPHEVRVAIAQMKRCNGLIADEVDTIDRILSRLMSPSGRTVSRTAVVERFGFPTESLNVIDYEYW